MSSRRRTARFWRSVLRMFAVYVVLVTAVYFLLDYRSAVNHLQDDPLALVLIIVGIAFGAAFSIAYWFKRDPELRRW